MFRVLVQTMLKTTEEAKGSELPRELERAELQSLFRDDFAAHAMIIKSRKAARVTQARLAA